MAEPSIEPAFWRHFPSSLALGWALVGCAAPAQAQPPSASPVAPSAAQQPQPSRRNSASPSAPSPAASNPSTSEPLPAAPSADTPSLPELTVRLVGLHVGGGPNDPDGKKPFISALEKGFPSFLDCYRQAEEPAKPGTFGVDLRIEAAGGHPTVQQTRTAMKGDALRQCLEQAFVQLDFARLQGGASVVSASIRFALAE